jgi:predicted nuclease with TOPRIM domain|tara:strand:+ start:1031 stop:1264 length:234 start_codon:yes stop_codon:yes gene_type:complete
MEFTVHLDGNPAIREEGFFESEVGNLNVRIKSLEFDNAELSKVNEELRERVTKLATRFTNQKGFQPKRNDRFNNKRN